MYKLFSLTFVLMFMTSVTSWANAGLSESGAAYQIHDPSPWLLFGPALAATLFTVFLQWPPHTWGANFRAHAYKLPSSIVFGLAAAAAPYALWYPPVAEYGILAVAALFGVATLSLPAVHGYMMPVLVPFSLFIYRELLVPLGKIIMYALLTAVLWAYTSIPRDLRQKVERRAVIAWQAVARALETYRRINAEAGSIGVKTV